MEREKTFRSKNYVETVIWWGRHFILRRLYIDVFLPLFICKDSH